MVERSKLDTYFTHSRFYRIGLGSTRWTEGLWHDRIEFDHEVFLPGRELAMQSRQNGNYLTNFEIIAGLKTGTYNGRPWGDGDCCKWLEGMARVYALTGDEEIDRKMDYWIDLIGKCQEPDGFLDTRVKLLGEPRLTRGRHPSGPSFLPPIYGGYIDDIYSDYEYNIGYLFTAASIHYRATGKRNFLNIAMKFADLLCEKYMETIDSCGWAPLLANGALDLYRVTENPRYKELAVCAVNAMRSFKEETIAIGHWCASWQYVAAVAVYMETGDKALIDAVNRIYEDMTYRKMYITGGDSSLYFKGRSVRGTIVSEAFGLAYELPNEAYNETCGNTYVAMLNYHLFLCTGEAKYIDVMEQAMYNSVLSAVDLDRPCLFYTNPLVRRKDYELRRTDYERRWFTHRCDCCGPSAARTIPMVSEFAYSLSDEGVWVNLYGSNTLSTQLPDGSALKITQKSNYPWDGKVTIEFNECEAKEPFTVHLRIPAWAEQETSLLVNGKPCEESIVPGTYVAVRRVWNRGDKIEPNIPMKPRLMECHPNVINNRNHAAVMRGPVVYCIEQDDLPDWVELDDVTLPGDIELTPRYDEKLLGGVCVLEGEAVTGPTPAAKAYERDYTGWNDKLLYKKMEKRTDDLTGSRPLKITLIPYYAWANRRNPYMKVWLPLPDGNKKARRFDS